MIEKPAKRTVEDALVAVVGEDSDEEIAKLDNTEEG